MRKDRDQNWWTSLYNPLQNRKRDWRILFTIPYFVIRSSRSKAHRHWQPFCNWFQMYQGGGFMVVGDGDEVSSFLPPPKPSSPPPPPLDTMDRWDKSSSSKSSVKMATFGAHSLDDRTEKNKRTCSLLQSRLNVFTRCVATLKMPV